MCGSYVLTLRVASQIHSTVARVNEEYQANSRRIGRVRAAVEATRLVVRDYLLEPTPETSLMSQAKLRENRTRIAQQVSRLESLGGADVIGRLRLALDEYYDSIGPILEWAPDKNMARTYVLLRKDITPRREKIAAATTEIESLNEQALRGNIQRIAADEERFTAFLKRMMVASGILGLIVALVSVFRVRTLESRSEEQHRVTQQAEQEMRKLSQQVVHAQEDERRSISRELHDEVGQMLTGLRMELRALLRMHGTSIEDFQARVEQARTGVDQTLQAIRDIAMGLRPSMLDDLGLDAALRWQAREFCRRHDIAVNVRIDADLTHLPDRCRTNLYRIVQEALTNCARHSKARSVMVDIVCSEGELRLAVSDDGVGLTNGSRSGGLGLIGIQERARELGGTAKLQARKPTGTSLTVTVPVAWKESHAESTSAAC